MSRISNRGAATIVDVARLANVSIKTVSRVTNGEPNVREQTRSRVEDAIRSLEYSPNPYAQRLGSLGRSRGSSQLDQDNS